MYSFWIYCKWNYFLYFIFELFFLVYRKKKLLCIDVVSCKLAELISCNRFFFFLDSLGFSRKYFLLPLFLNDIFVVYGFLTWQLFLFQHFKDIVLLSSDLHSFWWKFYDYSNIYSPYIMCHFSLAHFKIISLVSSSLIMMYLSIVSFNLSVHWVSWICKSVSFT